MTEEKTYKNEHINYSNYKPSEIINIDKYISEHNRGIINSIAGSMSGETHLLISQTGSGKTYTILELLKEFKFKAIFNSILKACVNLSFASSTVKFDKSISFMLIRYTWSLWRFRSRRTINKRSSSCNDMG